VAVDSSYESSMQDTKACNLWAINFIHESVMGSYVDGCSTSEERVEPWCFNDKIQCRAYLLFQRSRKCCGSLYSVLN
jgi:hypothetical protein